MIIVKDVNLPLDTDFSSLLPIMAKELKTEISNIKSAKLYRKSVDARHKNNVCFCCSILVEAKSEGKLLKNCKKASFFRQEPYIWQKCETIPDKRPVIIGFGPAGMFAGLVLARAGLKPIIFERGYDVDRRQKDVSDFFGGKKLNPESNIQFGEGGAGTFSDGKLNTGIKDPRIREVLKTFVSFGAKENVLTDSKPHIGTDILRVVVKNIRNEIIDLGGDIYFAKKLDGIFSENGRLSAISVNKEKIECERLILCIGHSARDTFEMLKDSKIEMEQKPFAVGVRIEHLQKDINKALYGDFYENENLDSASYKMATHLQNGRGVYTFCMCPGGEVVNASSEEKMIAVNGMSENARNKENANSALLVSVYTSDFGSDDCLAGCRLQREIENKAYSLGGGKVPITTVGHFVFGKEAKIGKVKPSVKPEWIFAELEDIFPSFVTDSLKKAITEFDKKIKGFSSFDAVITAPETRSSSPIRILRNEKGESLSLTGFFPCGEGAGYAGGITSAAVDGMKAAENLIRSYM
ncbi:MAG: hypothetical protein MJ090_00275 [Clostridia bacterium]|nr:hypothetical protein [Clostridia bacterium]